MIQLKGIIGILIFVIVLIALGITLIIRARKKSGVKGFLQKNNILYNELLVAHESQHYIAIQSEASTFHLVKYSQKKKAYQVKTFAFSELDRADFYLDGRKIFSMNASTELGKVDTVQPDPNNRNVVSVRMFIKGMDLPYIMTIDQFAEGNGSAISDRNLRNNVGRWQAAFFDISRG